MSLDPRREMEGWWEITRKLSVSGAQERLDIYAPRGTLPLGRRVRMVLLRDATSLEAYLRPSGRVTDGFNLSAWRLLSSRWTTTPELAHLCVHGWGMEYNLAETISHRSFQSWMVVPVALRHVAQWGHPHSRAELLAGAPEGSREIHVVEHLAEGATSWGTLNRRASNPAGDALVKAGTTLLTLSDEGWEIYAQLAADDGPTHTLRAARALELAQAAEQLAKQPRRPLVGLET